jgi:hypothetical protein
MKLKVNRGKSKRMGEEDSERKKKVNKHKERENVGKNRSWRNRRKGRKKRSRLI